MELTAVLLLTIAAVVVTYLLAVYKQRRRSFWSGGKITAFLSGAGMLTTAVALPLLGWPRGNLQVHMVQHLLVGMLAPLGLVLGAPLTLMLRMIPVSAARRITGVLRSQFVQIVGHPVMALVLNIGGMYVLYLTPLYAATLTSPLLHYLVHFHFLAAGYLFCWTILVGPDPAPHPAPMRFRVLVLLVSMAAHAILGKLMYAYQWPRYVPHSTEEIRAAAQIMYYGGDFAEVLLAIALFGMWYRHGGSRPYNLYAPPT